MTTPDQDDQPDAEEASIAAALGRLEAIVRKRPEVAQGTNRSVTTVLDGLRCESAEGDWRVQTDLPKALGGSASGPTPGMLGRVALGGCLAMGYQLHAARLGVELTSIRVEIEADSDDAGMLFLDETRPGYGEVRYHVEIVSPESDERVLKVLDEGDSLSPYLDVFSNSTPMRRTTSFTSP